MNNNNGIKVIQFGEGNFLRAFVDWMIYKMNEQGIFNGQVAVVQPLKNGLIHILKEQDYTYTHYLKGVKNGVPVKEHYKNDTIKLAVNPYDDFEGFLDLAKIDSANIIVSNTTEAGIVFDGDDKFNEGANVTFPAKLTHLLYERFKLVDGDQDKGFILLPCELIDKNADKLKEAVVKYVKLWNLGDNFLSWVNEANTFCNTLVDRIVPGFPRDTIEEVWSELGYKDNLVVESEQFNLWVIEGNEKVHQAFPADDAGCNVLFVEDVTPYKLRKVRILNGAHTSLVPVGILHGVETVMEAIEDEMTGDYLMKTLFEEIIPTLTLSKEALETFAAEVLERFNNPFVKHYLMSISLNSMSKYKARILPTVLDYLDVNDRLPKRLVAALASYIVFYRGVYNGRTIERNDNEPIIKLYDTLWKDFDGSDDNIGKIVLGVLAYEANWQGNLNHVPGLTDMVIAYVKVILNDGIDTLLNQINEVT